MNVNIASDAAPDRQPARTAWRAAGPLRNRSLRNIEIG